MRILFFINSLHESGGTERVTTVLANYWTSLGHQVSVLTLQPTDRDFFKLSENIVRFELNRKKTNIYFSHLVNVYKLRKLVREISPDVFIDVATALSLISIPALFALKVKHISWEHFNASINWNPITTPLARYLCGKFCDHIVTLTNKDKIDFNSKYSATNVLTIGNPVTIDRPPEEYLSVDAKNRVKSQLGLDLDKKYVVAVGRFTRQKGFDLLLKSWLQIHKKIANWNLVIVGNGPELSNLENLRSVFGLNECVHFAQPTTNISNYYIASEIMACSSRFEGLPLVLIEAKFFGLPIVSYDCHTGPRDIVRHNVDGILVEPENIDEFSTQILSLMKDEKRIMEMSRRCQDDIDRFGIADISRKWEELF
jgi:glycosyltransferase involved in cell wall biosynthesis